MGLIDIADLTDRNLSSPLYLLPAADLPKRRVSDVSCWSDRIWRFKQTTAGLPDAVFDWEFPMPGGMSTSPQWAVLLDLGRRLLWSILENNQRGSRPKPSTIRGLATVIRYLLQWMARNNYANFAELDLHAADQFSHDLIAEKSDDINEDDGATARNVATYLDVLIRVYEQSRIFQGLPSAVMPGHPFNGASAHDIAHERVAKVVGAIPPVPDQVFLPLVTEALAWLDAPARDILRLLDNYELGRLASERDHSNSYIHHINHHLVSYRFDDGGSLGKPWREPLKQKIANGPKSDESHELSRQFRALIEDLRDACSIVIQAEVGLRISELAGLKVEPRNADGLPACIEIRKSLSGLNEIFYIKGRVFKGDDHYREVEWVAGLRPVGTDYIPDPIRALIVLDKLFRPWRKGSGSGALLLGLGRGVGLPREYNRITRIRNNSLREGQKSFLRQYVTLPPLFRDWNLTTHQWRKSFAMYLIRSDERLLASVSDHFQHLSAAITEQGYVGADPELLGIIDDVATREAARLTFEAVTGKSLVGGKMAEIIENQAPQISALFGPDGTDEDKIERLYDVLKDDDVRVWAAEWGKCFFRSETALCHYRAKGSFDLSARRPHYGQRQPGLCCVCSNLMVSEAHVPFWRERHVANLMIYKESLACGEDASAAVAAERVRTAAAALRKMNIVVETVLSARENDAV